MLVNIERKQRLVLSIVNIAIRITNQLCQRHCRRQRGHCICPFLIHFLNSLRAVLSVQPKRPRGICIICTHALKFYDNLCGCNFEIIMIRHDQRLYILHFIVWCRCGSLRSVHKYFLRFYTQRLPPKKPSLKVSVQ